MRNATLLSAFFVTLILSAPVFAQTNTPPVPAPKILSRNIAGMSPSGCPVAFSVQRRSSGAIVWTNDRSQTYPAQGVNLTLQKASANRIVKAEITVHGTDGNVRFLPLESSLAAESGSDLAETFTVQPTEIITAARFERMLWTRSLATISSVEVTAVEFTDGTAWHEAAPGTCIAVPSGFLFVSGR